MHELTHIDLFSGIGGFALAARWAGFRTVCFSEIDPYASAVLRKHWPDVPNVGDITRAEFVPYAGATLLTGGFPCQPFSLAGKRAGAKDDRFLWPRMLEVIATIKPTWIVGENVAGIVRMELDRVLSDLEGEGYTALPLIIPACAVDARHRRDRVWIVAHSDGAKRRPSELGARSTEPREDGGREEAASVARVGRQVLADGQSIGRREVRGRAQGQSGHADFRCQECGEAGVCIAAFDDGTQAYRCGNGHIWDSWDVSDADRKQLTRGRPRARAAGRDQSADPCRWPAEPAVGGAFDGLSRELDKIGGLNETEKARAREVLRALRGEAFETAFQWAVGGFPCLSTSEILLALMCELHEGAYSFGSEMESGEASERAVRVMWRHIESARSPHRRRYKQQHAQQYSDALRELSHNSPSLYPKAWTAGCWEDGIERTCAKMKHRVDRIKGLGNAIVPQVAFQILKAIKAIES